MKKNITIALFLWLVFSFIFMLGKLSHIDRDLYRAAKKDDLAYAKKLVKHKSANINLKTKTGKTPLMRAAMYGRKRFVHFLLTLQDKNKKRIVDFDAVDTNGETALHKAAKKNNITSAKMLVFVGADKDKQNKWGQTPLHIAAKRGYLEIVKYLVKNGANKAVKNKKGNTPLHEAANSSQKKVVQYLINQGACLKTKNKKGRMPIDDAKGQVKEMIAKKYK